MGQRRRRVATEQGVGVELLPDPSFETLQQWTLATDVEFPGSSIHQGSTGIAAARTGAAGIAMSNLADGHVRSDPVPVTPGGDYDLSTQLRGALATTTAGQAEAVADFYDPAGALLTGESTTLPLPVTGQWIPQTATVTAPTWAATARLRLGARHIDGWVAFDDAAISPGGASGGVTVDTQRVTYRLGGQPIATRTTTAGGDTLSYLVADHLGSTSAAHTPTDGTTLRQRYLPYGAPRGGDPAALPTDRTYTGQIADRTPGSCTTTPATTTLPWPGSPPPTPSSPTPDPPRTSTATCTSLGTPSVRMTPAGTFAA